MTAATDRAEFVRWIADHFQARHTPELPRERAMVLAEETMTYVEQESPFGHPDFRWDREGAIEIAQDEIDSSWEHEA